ncbi:MAG: helix-turn-helix transcriptional regulator [Acidimicrobiia bacterium]
MPTDDPTGTAMTSIVDFDARVSGIAALADPLRRGLFRFVTAQSVPVSRDAAASGMGVPRHVAKFHLDRLVHDGLLAVEYARPPGRRGPGAGRPAKLYSRSSRELTLSVPQRQYELAARLLADAVTISGRDSITVADALTQVARDTGRAVGAQARHDAEALEPVNVLAVAVSALERAGYEPRVDGPSVTLVNCPFHVLAREHTDLVCGMNLDLLTGLVEDLASSNLQACLEPATGLCCVRLRDASA